MAEPFSIACDHGTLIGERAGAGTPLVLIHGFGGSRHDWTPVTGALPVTRPIIRYDQRGFGESTGQPGALFSHSDDLLALLDDLCVQQADLCGLSLGGATALAFTLNHPERVRKLVLVSPLMAGWNWSSSWVDLWKAIGRKARAGDMDAARALWWQHPLFESTRACPNAELLRTSIATFHGRQWVQDDQRPELPEIERLHLLSVPTLLLTGELDIEDFRLIADAIESAAPGIDRRNFPGAGHLLNFERPEAVATAIEAFLTSASDDQVQGADK